MRSRGQEGEGTSLVLTVGLLLVVGAVLFFLVASVLAPPRVIVVPSTPSPTLVAAGFSGPEERLSLPITYYGMDGQAVEVHRAVEYSATGRKELFVYYNDGPQAVDFQVLYVAPKSMAASDADLTFSSPPSEKTVLERDPILLFRYVVGPGEPFREEILAPSSSRSCFLYAPVPTPVGDELNRDFQSIRNSLLDLANLEGIVNMDRATGEQCHAVSERVARILTERTPLAERASALAAFVSELRSNPSVSEPSALEPVQGFTEAYYAFASELVPAAQFRVLLGPAGEGPYSAKLRGVVYNAEGEAVDASSLASLSDFVDEQNGLAYVDVAVDLRRLGLRGGALPVNSVSLNVVFQSSKRPDETRYAPLLVAVEHVNANEFLSIFPKRLSFIQYNGESVRKPVFLVNNLPYSVSVQGCGFQGAGPASASVALVNAREGCVLSQAGEVASYASTEVLDATEVFDGATESELVAFSSREDLFPFVLSDEPLSCADAPCTCDELQDDLAFFEERFARHASLALPSLELYQSLYGSTQFKETRVIQTSNVRGCILYSPFDALSLESERYYAVSLSATLSRERPLEYQAALEPLRGAPDLLSALQESYAHATRGLPSPVPPGEIVDAELP